MHLDQLHRSKHWEPRGFGRPWTSWVVERRDIVRALFVAAIVLGAAGAWAVGRWVWPWVTSGDPEVAEGFQMTEVADGIGAPTCLNWVDSTWLLICDNDADAIHLFRLETDGSVTHERVFVDGFDQPQGLHLDGDRLFVSDRGRLTRFDLDGANPDAWSPANRTVLIEGIPAGNHQTNAVHSGPNGTLLWHSGSTCNACDEIDVRNAALLMVDPESGAHEVVASGVRNSYDGAWIDGVGYVFTDNGRDWEGDDFPPEELDLWVNGSDYGWPRDVPEDPIPQGSLAPVATFTPHGSANGVAVRPLDSSLPGGPHSLYVTVYGSWNAVVPTGGEIVRVDLLADSDAALGWSGETTVVVNDVFGVLGISFHPDGTLYFANHLEGTLHRLTF